MTDFVQFCPGGGSTLVMPNLQFRKIPLCMYVIDFSVRQLSNKKLSNKTTLKLRLESDSLKVF